MAKKEKLFGEYIINESLFLYIITEIGIDHNGDLQIVKN